MTTDATAETGSDPWRMLDDLIGSRAPASVSEPVVGECAFYGRCSTEDNQDPKTSRAWQLQNAERFVGPIGGTVVQEFFDIGQSRSVTWDRRRAASQLIAELKNPARGWNAIVVGEGTRCWFGNQFSLVAPRFAAYGVELWIPELGGKYDPLNPSHKMLMSILGGMSESERQHVQARVRAAMDAQVLNEGRHQGGRAPYGYRVVDAGPHPNPRKAAQGARLRVLEIDDERADVVRRIFAAYAAGNGDRAIAGLLNRDDVPCPSADRPEQNRHRQADGWQGSTVRAILDNPRYTGYAVFGRWTKHEMLLDPDDVAAGNVTRFKRAAPDKIVRSRVPAHPAIITVEQFTQAQMRRRAKNAGGLATARKAERGPGRAKRTYLLRGMVRCDVCKRRMAGEMVRANPFYRCAIRTMAPGAAALADHPATVNVREDVLTAALNEWLGRVFGPAHRDETVAALLGAQEGMTPPVDVERAKMRRADADQRVRRFQDAIGAGVDPVAVVDALNQAQAERAAAQIEIDNASSATEVEAAEVYAILDSLGDVAEALASGKPASLARLYESLELDIRYVPGERAAHVEAKPRVDSARVRRGT